MFSCWLYTLFFHLPGETSLPSDKILYNLKIWGYNNVYSNIENMYAIKEEKALLSNFICGMVYKHQILCIGGKMLKC